ncbi:PP2C family protein-serine/threonine phosphatase [Kitasatospora mediocidica]|uniref:PP2C family protein-serine/threonine phosphatase n=1 Tax=Kitasatospora mediocidica TaxID=58352 RepID=UPI00055E37DE|nr:SpoIIE family protein phosphatase [Kitasatospora mediocidica]
MPATGDGRAPSATHRPGAAAGVLATRRGSAAGRPAEFPGSLPVSRPTHPTDVESRAGHLESAPIPRPRTTVGGPVASAPETPFRLLVIEDDASDVALIDQLVRDSCAPIELHWASGIEQAAAQLSTTSATGRRSRPRGAGFSCVLLDLAAPATSPAPDQATATPGAPGTAAVASDTPDSSGDPDQLDRLDGLRELLRRAPNTAVVVLTDAAASDLGAAAVAAGAQDFLVKHETDGPLLARALRYAVERKRADESQRRLVEAELRGQENARLQRHLLPTPLLDGARLSFTRRYRPGRRRALLGGDFYDAVRTDDGTVHVVIGDVCGHGPDEAALGVALRIAWRTLVFAGLTGQALLTTLQHVLEHERRSDEIFATLCMMVLSSGPAETTGAVGVAGAAGAGGAAKSGKPGSRSATTPPEHARLYLAGHPSPLLLSPDGSPVLLPFEQAGPALGLLPCDDGQAVWPAQEVELPPGWGLLLYTDGLVEGRVGNDSRRLGQDGLIELIGNHQAAGLTRGRLVDSAIAEVEELNGEALTDDVAVLLLERTQTPLIMG